MLAFGWSRVLIFFLFCFIRWCSRCCRFFSPWARRERAGFSSYSNLPCLLNSSLLRVAAFIRVAPFLVPHLRGNLLAGTLLRATIVAVTVLRVILLAAPLFHHAPHNIRLVQLAQVRVWFEFKSSILVSFLRFSHQQLINQHPSPVPQQCQYQGSGNVTNQVNISQTFVMSGWLSSTFPYSIPIPHVGRQL